MRSRDEVLREFGTAECMVAECKNTQCLRERAMADRIRELEAQQAASEPVAWALFLTDHESLTHFTTNKDRAAVWGRKAVPLYAHPSAAGVTVTEAVDRIIYSLDEYARELDPHDYGLPVYGAPEHMVRMRELIVTILTAASERREEGN